MELASNILSESATKLASIARIGNKSKSKSYGCLSLPGADNGTIIEKTNRDEASISRVKKTFKFYKAFLDRITLERNILSVWTSAYLTKNISLKEEYYNKICESISIIDREDVKSLSKNKDKKQVRSYYASYEDSRKIYLASDNGRIDVIDKENLSTSEVQIYNTETVNSFIVHRGYIIIAEDSKLKLARAEKLLKTMWMKGDLLYSDSQFYPFGHGVIYQSNRKEISFIYLSFDKNYRILDDHEVNTKPLISTDETIVCFEVRCGFGRNWCIILGKNQMLKIYKFPNTTRLTAKVGEFLNEVSVADKVVQLNQANLAAPNQQNYIYSPPESQGNEATEYEFFGYGNQQIIFAGTKNFGIYQYLNPSKRKFGFKLGRLSNNGKLKLIDTLTITMERNGQHGEISQLLMQKHNRQKDFKLAYGIHTWRVLTILLNNRERIYHCTTIRLTDNNDKIEGRLSYRLKIRPLGKFELNKKTQSIRFLVHEFATTPFIIELGIKL